jgi:ketosteroid isomerase-like protein
MSLPKPIADYFAADKAGDASALARCFTTDAVVRDEGGTFQGSAAIKSWNEQAKAKYHYAVEPLSAAEHDGQVVVIGKVTGDFPGSPVELKHSFQIANGKIASLEIH